MCDCDSNVINVGFLWSLSLVSGEDFLSFKGTEMMQTFETNSPNRSQIFTRRDAMLVTVTVRHTCEL